MTRRATSVVRRIRLWLKELPLVFGFIAGVVFTRSLTLLSMTENDFGETYPFSGVDSSLKPFRLDHHSSNLNEVVVGRNIPKAPPLEKKKQTPLPTKTEDATKEDLRPNVTTKEATNAVIVEHVARKSLMMEDQTKKNATIINFQEGLSATVKNTAHARRKYVRYNIPWEFYKEQIESGNLTAGQEFLDFAVVGFPKCGTSTMMYWLAQHPEVQILKFEIKSLQKNHPAHIIKRMFTLPEGPYLRGYKSPNDVEDHRALNKLNEHYPKTKLFVGIRHPVRWFESFYNYRVQNGLEMPPADKLPIRGALENRGVSIDRANFHKALVHFGKTNLNDKERNLFSYSRLVKTDVSGIVPAYLTNKVFLYDTDQLGDKNETRVESFRFDVANYLGLNETMPPVLQVSPGQKNLNITEQALRDSKKIRICDDQYREVRKKLLLVGGKVGLWIKDYFLKSPDVVISNSGHFHEILTSYLKDPC